MTQQITAESLDNLANEFLNKPNVELHMDDPCRCVAGVLGNTNFEDGIRKIFKIFGVSYDVWEEPEDKLTTLLIRAGIGNNADYMWGATAGFWTGDTNQLVIDSHKVGRILRVGAIKLRANCQTAEEEHSLNLLKEKASESMKQQEMETETCRTK